MNYKSPKINPVLDEWSQNILKREQSHCHDREYARHLAKLTRKKSPSWDLWAQGRPMITEVESAISLACQISPKQQDWDSVLYLLYENKQKPVPPLQLISDLESDNWKTRLLARHTLVELGGTAINALCALPAEKGELIARILENIEIETKNRLADQMPHSFCQKCLVRCQKHSTSTPWRTTVTYYGCRICNQSRYLFYLPQGVGCVFDNNRTTPQSLEAGFLQVNWLKFYAVFDFDHVEIIQATDEEVERFAVQVGNDTDPYRKPRYETMHCVIKPECILPRNTLKILESMFGEVQHAPIP
jgi:hypothetical protein